MVKKGKKYYEGSYAPLPIYHREDGEILHSKSIRITRKELTNWNTKLIHEFLQGDINSIDVKALRNKLEVYHNLFEMIIEKHFSDLDPSIIEYIENNKEFAEEI